MTTKRLGSLLFAVLLIVACSTNSAPPAPAPAAPAQPVLVFFRFESQVSYFALVTPDGTIVRKVDLPSTGVSVYQDGTAGLLLNRGGQTTDQFMYMTPDGAVNPMPSALQSAFAFGAGGPGGLGATSLDANPAFCTPTLMAGVLNSGQATSYYAVLDLKRGRMVTVLTAVADPTVNGWPLYNMLPAGISTDGNIARIVILRATAGRTRISTWALAEVNLPQGKVTSLETLPLPQGVDSRNLFSPAVSPDGRFLVYQYSPDYSSYATAIFSTDIMERRTGKITVADGAPFVLVGHPRLLRFSPDGAMFYVFGERPVAGGIRNRVLAVYDTSGRPAWSLDVGDSFYNDITPVAWLDAQHLVYTTRSTARRGDLGSAVPHSYVVNVVSRDVQELTRDLGDPIAVLR